MIYDHLGEAISRPGTSRPRSLPGRSRSSSTRRTTACGRRSRDPPASRRPEVRCRRGRAAAATSRGRPQPPRSRRVCHQGPAPPAAAPLAPGRAVELAQRWAAEWASFPGMRGVIDLTAKNRRGASACRRCSLWPRPRLRLEVATRSDSPPWWRRRPRRDRDLPGARAPRADGAPLPGRRRALARDPAPPVTLIRLLAGNIAAPTDRRRSPWRASPGRISPGRTMASAIGSG